MEQDWFTIDEWCNMHRISRGTWYNLKRAGDAPEHVKFGKRTLISKKANDKWVRHHFHIAS